MSTNTGTATGRIRPVVLGHALMLAAIAAIANAQETGPVRATPRAGQLSISVESGRLSATLDRCSIRSLADQLLKAAGIALTSTPDLQDDLVSAEVKDMALDAALREVLRGYDTFFYYGSTGNARSSLRAIWVYPKGTAMDVQPVRAESWASARELAVAATNRDPAVRERAYAALVSRPDDRSRELVIQAVRGITETDEGLRQRVLSNAISLAVTTPDLLAELARADASGMIRLMALEALIGEPSAVDAAEIAVNDPSELVRDRARQIIELQGTRGKTPPLRKR